MMNTTSSHSASDNVNVKYCCSFYLFLFDIIEYLLYETKKLRSSRTDDEQQRQRDASECRRVRIYAVNRDFCCNTIDFQRDNDN